MDQPPPSPQQAAPPPPQPPGWYFDGQGQRWWDGSVWGPPAPASGRSSDDKTLSMLAHGGVLVGGFVVPLVLYLISNDRERPETRWHAREALNFQLTFLATYMAGFFLFFGSLAVSGAFTVASSEPAAGAGIGLGFGFVGFFMFVFAAVVANFAFSIMGAIRANNGVRWKYPIRFPFVKAEPSPR